MRGSLWPHRGTWAVVSHLQRARLDQLPLDRVESLPLGSPSCQLWLPLTSTSAAGPTAHFPLANATIDEPFLDL